MDGEVDGEDDGRVIIPAAVVNIVGTGISISRNITVLRLRVFRKEQQMYNTPIGPMSHNRFWDFVELVEAGIRVAAKHRDYEMEFKFHEILLMMFRFGNTTQN